VTDHTARQDVSCGGGWSKTSAYTQANLNRLQYWEHTVSCQFLA